MKKYFTTVLLFSALSLPTLAQNAVFSNNETETINIKPVSYNSSSLISANETTSSYKTIQAKSKDSQLSEQNFVNAVNNLDSAQVEIREQLSSYTALMNQSKSAYLAKKDEYNSYKKEYNKLKKKMKKIEKSKKLIQDNLQPQGTY